MSLIQNIIDEEWRDVITHIRIMRNQITSCGKEFEEQLMKVNSGILFC